MNTKRSPESAAVRFSSELPSSIGDWVPSAWSGLLGLLGLVLGAVVIQWLPLTLTWSAVVVSFTTALAMLLSEFFLGTELRRSIALMRSNPATIGYDRLAAKLLGLLVTIALLWFVYWLLPVYAGMMYLPFWEVCTFAVPLWIILAVPYFALGERCFPGLNDGYWHLGQLALGRWHGTDWSVVQQHLLSWGVRGFFIPLMFSQFVGLIVYLKLPSFASVNFLSIYTFLYHLCFVVDLGFVIVGYTLPLRILNAHIRSTESTLLGWGAALICYEPFWSAIRQDFITYSAIPGSAHPWYTWLDGQPVLQMLWGTVILVLTGAYVAVTVCFGPRFSNLTHRGIIRFGPYAWTKHPAYITKLVSYCMISVPFIPHGGWDEAFRRCLLLGLLCGIYRLRAITEERHLSWDPTYREYAAEVDARHRRWAAWLRGLFVRPFNVKDVCEPTSA